MGGGLDGRWARREVCGSGECENKFEPHTKCYEVMPFMECHGYGGVPRALFVSVTGKNNDLH